MQNPTARSTKSAPKSVDEGAQTRTLDAYLRNRHDASCHEKGHSAKVFRYRLAGGCEVAVEKRKGTPILYVPAAALSSQATGITGLTMVAAGREGRNSNLNTLDSFRDQALWRLPVQSMADVDNLLGRIT